MKLNWGFGIAVVYILFAGSMVLFAVTVSRQKYDLVTEHYYEDAVNFQQQIDAGNNGTMVDSKISVTYLPLEKAVAIESVGKNKNIQGTLFFYKPDKASDDFKLNFSTGETGKQIIPLKDPAHGYWKINASWQAEGKACATEKRIFIQ